MKRAIRAHAVDFAAIIALLVLSIAVSGYILHHERLRFPFLDTQPYNVNAEFSTAQAVTPGQGQTVRISGVQIGDIGAVTLRNGLAVVRMDIQPKYRRLIHTDASLLLRPKTGLKDMFIEMNPGTKSAPVARSGYTIPVSQTVPDINLDEVLGSLDGDTRGYLQLLVNGAGKGFNGRANDFGQVLQRFLPLHRDLARVSEAVAVRGTNLRRLVNSLARLNTALASKRVEIGTLINSSAVVFRAFANENANVSRAVADLPGTLRQTTATLSKVRAFADLLGPASQSLIPAVSALPAANASITQLARPSTSIVRDQIRPFVITARPVIRDLKPAAQNLAKGTPGITRTFGVLNHLVNLLDYQPGGGDHSYLWWLAWLDHDARTLFSIQDANGDYRPLFLQLSCASLAATLNGNPASGVVLNITQILSNANLCPQQAKAVAAAARTGVLRANSPITTHLPQLPAPMVGTGIANVGNGR